MILGSIEAGGTKFVCAVGNENYEVIDKAIFPTIDPATTSGNCIAFFKKYPEMQAMSVASFGPIDIDKHSATLLIRQRSSGQTVILSEC